MAVNQTLYQQCYNFSNADFSFTRLASCVLVNYALPAVCIVGIVLNFLCTTIFVLSAVRHRKDNSTMRFYLTALTIFDTVQLTLSIPLIWISRNIEYFSEDHSKHPLYYTTIFSIRYLYPILLMANYASIWTIVVICIQRYFAVIHPIAIRYKFDFLTHKWTILALILLSVILINIIRFWEFEIVEGKESYVVQLTPMSSSFSYIILNNCIIYTLIIYAVPFCLLVVMNTRIMCEIRKSTKNPMLLMQKNCPEQREHRTSWMVVTIVVAFFLCHTPAVALRWWDYFRAGDMTDSQTLLENLSNFLINLNSAANPLIYYLFSRGFHDLFNDFQRQLTKSPYTSMSINGDSCKTPGCRPHLRLHHTPSLPAHSGIELNSMATCLLKAARSHSQPFSEGPPDARLWSAE